MWSFWFATVLCIRPPLQPNTRLDVVKHVKGRGSVLKATVVYTFRQNSNTHPKFNELNVIWGVLQSSSHYGECYGSSMSFKPKDFLCTSFCTTSVSTVKQNTICLPGHRQLFFPDSITALPKRQTFSSNKYFAFNDDNWQRYSGATEGLSNCSEAPWMAHKSRYSYRSRFNVQLQALCLCWALRAGEQRRAFRERHGSFSRVLLSVEIVCLDFRAGRPCRTLPPLAPHTPRPPPRACAATLCNQTRR